MFLRLKNERFLPLCSLSSQSLVGRDKQQQESPYLITRYVLALTKLRHCFLRCLYSVQRDARKDSELRNSKTVQMVKLGLTVDNNFRQILAARRHSGLSPPPADQKYCRPATHPHLRWHLCVSCHPAVTNAVLIIRCPYAAVVLLLLDHTATHNTGNSTIDTCETRDT